jgi:hypothetical protein
VKRERGEPGLLKPRGSLPLLGDNREPAALPKTSNPAMLNPEEVRSMGNTPKKGRDSRTGQFIPVKEARQRPNPTTVEQRTEPGKGVK